MEEYAHIQTIFNYIGISVDKKNHNEIVVNYPVFYTKKNKEYSIKGYETITRPFGTFFADFINCDFTLETDFNNFFKKYSLSLLDLEKFKRIFKNNVCSEETYNRFVKKLMEDNLKKLLKLQEQIDMILDYCLINPAPKVSKLSPIERLYVLERTNETFTIFNAKKIEFINIHYFSKDAGNSEKDVIENLIKKKTSIGSIDLLIPHSIESILYIQLCDILKEDISFKSCKNCDRYFVAENKRIEYCNELAPDSNKTCREIGRKKKYYDNIKNDKALDLYNKVYYRKAQMSNRNPDLKNYIEDYEYFKTFGKKKLEKYKAGKITSEEFINWINKNI